MRRADEMESFMVAVGRVGRAESKDGSEDRSDGEMSLVVNEGDGGRILERSLPRAALYIILQVPKAAPTC